jgi:RHS repeat-associated protein
VEGFDQPNSVADSATGQSITGTYQAQVAAGASGAKRSTAAGNADVGNTHILALRPFIPNLPPTVSFTSPPNNAVFSAPANITLTAAASDQDGTIRRVEFIRVAPGPSTLLASVTTPPYSFVWSAVPQGTYGVIARAVDNRGAERLAGVNFEVKQQSALHFIHVDHLNTPRLVADAAGTVVWKWDQQEPFGDAVPDENPSGLGAFEMPLAFPGTYRDKEIGGKLYNWNRTVDPALGRYLQSDAIGLIGGSNTYLHLGANPLRKVDLMGYVGDTVEGDGGRGKGGIGIPDIRGKASRDAASQIQKLIEKWFCPPGCDDIQEQIEAKITELRVRYVQMTADVHNLYCTRPFGAFSWLGHQFRYNRVRQELKELVDKAKAMGCSYDPEADEWIRREPPVCPAR